MLLTEYDEAATMELFREEGREEGRKEGFLQALMVSLSLMGLPVNILS